MKGTRHPAGGDKKIGFLVDLPNLTKVFYQMLVNPSKGIININVRLALEDVLKSYNAVLKGKCRIDATEDDEEGITVEKSEEGGEGRGNAPENTRMTSLHNITPRTNQILYYHHII